MRILLFISLLLCTILNGSAQVITPGGSVNFCVSGILTLSGHTNSNIQWYNGTAAISGATGTTLVVTAPGSYSAQITGGGPQENAGPVTVTISTPPVPGFTFSPSGLCSNVPVAFTNTSTGTGLSYSWNFNDPNSGAANTSTAVNPVHEFIGSAGNGNQTFNVSLTTTSGTCSQTVTQAVTVKQVPSTLLDGTGVTVYNGINYFTSCSSGPATLDFVNISSTQSTNTNYQIVWGDGSPDYNSSTFTALQHNYALGNYPLLFIVTGANGCIDTGYYRVFVGSNPAIGFGTDGSTAICSNSSLSFNITGFNSNPPTTSYTVTFNDGTPPTVFSHPPPSSITHQFQNTSCGTVSGSFNNSFSTTISASNPCLSSVINIVPIYVTQKPVATFSISPSDTVCVNNNVTITNTSPLNNNNNNGNCQPGKFVWTISPSTGYTLTGSLGNENSTNPGLWVSGSNSLGLNFSVPGVYTIKLKTGNTNCGTDSLIRTICVNPAPSGSFTVSDITGCAPLNVTTTSSTNTPLCGSNTYLWTVAYSSTAGCTPATSGYSFTGGTTANSAQPQFQFNNPGVYTVALWIIAPTASCSTLINSQQIIVKDKPFASFNTFPASVCENTALNISAQVSCYTSGAAYSWSFPGATPSTSGNPSGATIIYNTSGNQVITLGVTNECGTTTITSPVVVKPTPVISVPANIVVCSGETVGPLTISSATGSVSFGWMNNNTTIGLPGSGTGGNIPAFTATNLSSIPVTATITANGTLNGCTGSSTFTITVNPKPSTPVATSPVSYCQGETATALTATASGSNSLLWYTTASGGTGSTTAPVPSTATVGSSTWYVSQQNPSSGCESIRVPVVVTIKTSPVIGGYNFSNPLQCGAANGSITLTGLTFNTTYIVSYIKNGGTITLSLTANSSGTIIIPGLSAGMYTDIHVILNGCLSPSLPDITLSDPSSPATPSALSNGPLCSGQTLNLSANTTTPGLATYNWSGPSGYNSSLQNPVIPVTTVSMSGTYSVTVTINGCTSAAGTVSVVINQTPATPAVSGNSPVCTGETINLNSSTTTPGSITYLWSGPGGFSSTDEDPVITGATLAMGGTYSVIATATTGNCSSAAGSTTIVVNQTPAITSSVANQPTLCNSSTGSITLNGLNNNSSYLVHYTFNTTPVAVSLTSNGSGVLVIPNLAAGNYTNIFVEAAGCLSNVTSNHILTDPNPPSAPAAGSNGPICSGNILSLTASNTPGSPTYSWSGPNGFTSSIQNPQILNASTLAGGTYNVTVTVAGCTSAVGSVIVVIDSTPAMPSVISNGPVCSDSTLNLSASTVTPGTITWQWTGPNGFSSTSQNPVIPNITTTANGTYQVFATAAQGGCVSSTASLAVTINATPAISNVTFSDPLQCNTATGSISLAGLVSGQSYTVNYLQGATPQTTLLSANSSGVIIIPNLPSGTYSNIQVVINGCRSLMHGPVTLVDPNPPSAPATGSNSPVCSGQTLSLTAMTTQPGAATYSWTGPDGFVSVLQNPVISTTSMASAGNYMVTVTINNCTSPSASIPVIINPLPSAPDVVTPVSYCINATAVALTATPAPGNTLNWYNVPVGGTSSTVAPVPLTTITGNTANYVSQTNSFGCEGPRDTINVIINPDAIAELNPTDTIGCPPFVLTPSVVGLQHYPANNGTYEWYADGISIGTGITFPGYTIPNENGTVTIKVKALSQFGCKSDSTIQVFNTYNLPHPSFEVIDSVGCGPLTVQVLNTTPNIGEFTYFWDFGNGQTSTLQQPGNIIFNTNPTFADTVYNVSLQIFSICDTITVTKTVRVKSKPKALFTPSSTTGCSPMNITFFNTSIGDNSTYYWDLGDGTTLVNNNHVPVQHTYNTGIVDTFTVTLIAVNECGSDTSRYDIIVSPNTIALYFAVNGPQNSGCAPHSVAFINNTVGGSVFSWNFGDGNILSTALNVDTVYHTYLSPGVYNVSLTAQNSCSDTTASMIITVYPKPVAGFTASPNSICQGLPVDFTNNSTGGTSYLWTFGDGTTSTNQNPGHTYSVPGLYTVKLYVYSFNAPGSVCVDSTEQQVNVVSTINGSFTMNPSNSTCAPLTVAFANLNLPSVTSIWDFGDGTSGSGDNITHTYNLPGVYPVTLTVTVPGGCTYQSTQVVTVNGPQGNFSYTPGFHCSPTVRFEATGSGYSDVTWNFGDGNSLTTTQLVVYHTYTNPGAYLPSVSFNNTAGCSFSVQGTDSVKIDKIIAGFTTTSSNNCGYTTVNFADTSSIFYGISMIEWNFGDGNFATGSAVSHNYTMAGTYPVRMIITGNSGCADTLDHQLIVQVNSFPDAQINASSTACTGVQVLFGGQTQSSDPLTFMQWSISNGVTGSGNDLTYSFSIPGIYTVRFIAGTASGCFDTAYHSITVNPSPLVTAGNDVRICLGNSTPLSASGANNYEWSPGSGLSCTDCPSPVATPAITTPYLVTGTNSFGCTDSEEVVVTVIQPLNMTVSPEDSICIGQSSNLLASGATLYSWTPAQGLNSTSISNPVATPAITTRYRVVGYDGFNCFTDTAYVLVAVGQYPVIDLGPDLTLSSGTIHPLSSTVTNGPIQTWIWTPSTDLSCNTCPLPGAFIKKDITYIVNATTYYGCSASDTICIKVFCEESQVFIPNAFTPDGDGRNDILMVRGKGIQSVKSFRVFNRWGEVVFEKANFPPNLPAFGWDGRIKGVAGGPDVFVYTAEVLCENGTPFTYKGNVSILK